MRRALLVATLTLAAAPLPLRAQDTAAPPVIVDGVMLPVPPLAPIGLPLPHIGLDTPKPRTKPQADERTDSDPATRPRRPQPGVPPVFVYAPVIVGAGTTKAPGESTPAKAAAATRQGRTGSLTIDTKDDDTPFAVFVDGLYVGSSEQLGESLTLDAGAHRVEVQADGHPAQRFSVRIAAGKTTTHATDLRASGTHDEGHAVEGAAAAPTSDAGPARLFIIAGCYAGNVPPVPATLPAGCDPSRMTTLSR